MRRRARRACRGFTLFELLVALAIFSLVSIMAYSGLDEVLAGREQTDELADRLAQFQLTFLNMNRDLSFAAVRTVRGEYGDTREPFIGAESGIYRIELTRQGRRNPDPVHLPRSTLERVAYALEDQVLYRLSWPVLDRAQDTQPRRRALLEGVRAMEIRFLDTANEWRSAWPPLNPGGNAAPLPRAVEVVLVTEDWGEVRRVFDLPEGA